VHIGGSGHEDFRPNTVRRHHEQGLLETFGDAYHATEAPDLAARE
jgi:hypothetical protein